MKVTIYVLFIVCLSAGCNLYNNNSNKVANAQYKYPDTKTVQASDTYFGITVYDPYRWLEDLKNPEVQDWFKTQADYTNTQLAKIPNQNKLIRELNDYDAMRSVWYSPLAKAGGKYFYQKRMSGEQASKLYYQQGEAGREVLLFDPKICRRQNL